jgi:hypothetical protein
MTVCRDLLAASWSVLPAGLQRIHAAGEARGRAQVRGAESAALRLLSWALGFPAAAADVPVSLRIEPRSSYELWRRSFGGHRFTTRVAVRDGLFAERFRGVEICLAIGGSPGGIEFQQRSAALAVGPLRCPLPAFLAPRVEARDEPGADPGSVRFWVRISLFGGRLVEYSGSLGEGP